MLSRNLRRTSALAAPTLMESGAPRTGRVHEYELCPEFAHSARHHRTANHSWRALSTCSRADYEKSNGQCHARVWRIAAVHVLANSSRVRIFSRDCSPLNATLTEVCWFALRCDPFKSWVQRQLFGIVILNQPSLYCPLLRCLCLLKHFVESANEHKTGPILGVRTSLH